MGLGLILVGISLTQPLIEFAQAQTNPQTEPPFAFDLTPTYDKGKITYKVALYSHVDWQITNLAIKIPLPPGTRYVEGGSQPGVTVTFDGQGAVTFFTSSFDRYIEQNFFTVEV